VRTASRRRAGPYGVGCTLCIDAQFHRITFEFHFTWLIKFLKFVNVE